MSPDSPVRIRIACSTGVTKILPSPISPVRAALEIASIAAVTLSSVTTSTTFDFEMKSTLYSLPR